MITRIEVDGFKSLNGFRFDVQPGLNILVGPNGAGKTNIILFFEFVSKLISEDLYNAVTKVGGAGAIFKKVGDRDHTNTITCTIQGCRKVKDKYIKYEYQFSIDISFDKDSIFFSKQSYRAGIVDSFSQDSSYDAWGLIITQSQTDKQSKPTVLLEKVDTKVFSGRLGVTTAKVTEADVMKQYERFFKDFNPRVTSLVRAAFILGEQNYMVYQDLLGGETFNIIPSKVKQPADSANPPGIKKDGSGLANTLYAMKKDRRQMHYGFPYFFEETPIEYDKATLQRIKDNIKLANRAIVNIDVDNDQFSNQLLVKVYLKGEDRETVLPLSAMSDGTIKWITLITAILTSRELFSIEEPENFLHPWMQAEIVKIMRSTFHSKSDHAFAIMTTHSESLLNYSTPEEVVITRMENGKTIVSRVANQQQLREEIQRTGFGLGYYYFSNALDNE